MPVEPPPEPTRVPIVLKRNTTEQTVLNLAVQIATNKVFIEKLEQRVAKLEEKSK